MLDTAFIYGRVASCCCNLWKNGGGKSNVIRAFWLAVQFIRNAQRTQHERASIPVNPFALNDYSSGIPQNFILYTLWMASNTGMVFRLQKRKFLQNTFITHPKSKKHWFFPELDRTLHSRRKKRNAEWLEEWLQKTNCSFQWRVRWMTVPALLRCVGSGTMCFFKGLPGYSQTTLAYSEDKDMLKAISDYAKAADLGIQDMRLSW